MLGIAWLRPYYLIMIMAIWMRKCERMDHFCCWPGSMNHYHLIIQCSSFNVIRLFSHSVLSCYLNLKLFTCHPRSRIQAQTAIISTNILWYNVIDAKQSLGNRHQAILFSYLIFFLLVAFLFPIFFSPFLFIFD